MLDGFALMSMDGRMGGDLLSPNHESARTNDDRGGVQLKSSCAHTHRLRGGSWVLLGHSGLQGNGGAK